MSAIQMLTDAELPHVPTDEEAGFGALRSTDGDVLPLAEMDVDARVRGLVARTTVRQVFVQSRETPIEATYVFPLPDRAAVTAFRVEVAGRVVVGKIEERGAARERYDAAIAEGKRAAIAEEERSGVFTVRVGNLMPKDRAVVTLELVGPLPWVDGEATYRFPLVVAPRYIPGAALAGASVGDGTALDTDAVPDASRISPPVMLPGWKSPVRLSLAVSVDAGGLPLGTLRSSLHAVAEETRAGVRTVRVAPGEKLNRDFVLRFTLGDAQKATSTLVVARDEQGDEGTWMLTLVPPTTAAAQQKPRDVVFVLDRSGSMGGWKMVCARRAVARMVDTLGPRDRFQVLAFDGVVETPAGLPASLCDGTDRSRFRAIEWLAKVEARGGTEMAQPLARAADLVGTGYADRERTIVLVTDGQVGNEDQILRELAPKLRGARVFALGIDRAVNAGFLARLGALGGGMSELVESEDRLDDVMDRSHRRLGSPVLTEAAIVADGLDVLSGTQVPSRVPDLFAGAPVVVSGRFRGDASRAALVVRAAAGESTWQDVVRAKEADAEERRALACVWARAQVRALEDDFAAQKGDLGALERRIVETSVRFAVLSRFTAFVAVDERVVNEGGRLERVVQPVESPDGWVDAAAAAAPRQPGGMTAPMAMPAPAQAMAPTIAGGYVPGAPSLGAPMGAPPPPPSGAPKAKRGILAGIFGGRATVDPYLSTPAPASPRRAAPPEPEEAALRQEAGPPPVPSELRARVEKLVAALVAGANDDALAEAVVVLGLLAPHVAVHERSDVTRLRNEVDAMRAVTSRDAATMRALVARIVALLHRLAGVAETPARSAPFWKR